MQTGITDLIPTLPKTKAEKTMSFLKNLFNRIKAKLFSFFQEKEAPQVKSLPYRTSASPEFVATNQKVESYDNFGPTTEHSSRDSEVPDFEPTIAPGFVKKPPIKRPLTRAPVGTPRKIVI